LRLAVYGVLAEGAGSGAGAYPVLLEALLARGHQVEFFGNPAYVRMRSLEATPGYRFHPLHLEAMDRLWYRTASLDVTRAVVAQLGIAAYQREAVRQIERAHERAPYDAILCTDMQPLWSSRLPVIAWPQSPPHTEASALRTPELARAVVRASGVARYAAVQAFYVYRALAARLALGCSDVYLCGSRWARDEWVRFGAAPERVRPFAYPIALDTFARVPALERKPTTTFLWLGRSVPRKRLDLFVEGFALVRARHPNVRARLIGDLTTHPFGRAVLERHASTPDLSVEAAVARANVPALFGEIDVLVQPSQNENFGFSVAEALAAGRAVVGGPTNGTLEYAGQAGFIFPEYTAESVALAMERAMHAVEREGPALSQRAREAASELALEAVTDRFCALCEELRAD
jgi:glycosyltransferase involved in cell wall biosynthesis